ncbi:MAG: nickel-dependent lactate racemase [Atopobiaceae bacterium]|jgi:nickel-dependent lactate racemase
MHISVGIGTREESFDVAEKNLIGIMHAARYTPPLTGEALVREALSAPVGTPRLKDLVHEGQRICIITSDVTRPLPTPVLLSPVMEELHRAHISDDQVLVAIALGSHRPQTQDELRRILGSYYGKLQVLNGDSQGLHHYGTTRAGTPVDILQEVAEADVRIALGNVEYHYFAGYSGGAKAIMPGVSTFEAIQANHALMCDPAAHSANIDSPVRQDLEEACRMVGLDFIVNVVLDENRQVVACVAGDFIQAHRAAAHELDRIYGCPVSEYADIVVVSQGGAPKDLNLYQLQKALDNAKHPVRPGGIIILVGSCNEGVGQPTFEAWMREAHAPQDVIDRLARGFKLGGHKAAAIAQIELTKDIYLVSDLDNATVRACFMHPYPSVAEALDAALSVQRTRLGREPRVLVMPHGGSTLPLMCTSTQPA